MFLVLDGLDGAGKSTQMARLADWLRTAGNKVTVCRDPGSTLLGDQVRQLLLQKSSMAIDPRSEMLLFMVARCQLVHEIVRPALAAGSMVLCDRFQMSTLVYQGHGGHVPLEEIRAVGQVATGGLEPTHTFVLDLPTAVALARIGRGLDRMESRGAEYLDRVRHGFLAEARRAADRCTVIDARQSVDQVAEQIVAHVQTLLVSHRPASGAQR
jgi:dTMP kinase